jgi:anti-sigma-K factor RskA
MSGEPETEAPVTRDDPLIAAEWALGLLEGEELMAARAKHAIDPDFAWRKQWWDDWFAPLSDEIGAAEPSHAVWERISTQVNGPEPASADVIMLQARVTRWRWVAALTSAAAAVALVLGFAAPTRSPLPQTSLIAAAPLVASVPIGDAGLRLDVTFIPASEQLLVSAVGLAADGVHDHELWLVPADGSPLQSLGVIAPGEVHSLSLPDGVTRQIVAGRELLLTREPLGGKPVGVDAGPVVAKGVLAPV